MATRTTISEKKAVKDADLPAGTHLGDFEIISLLGRGGMGAVYLAVKPGLDRKVAIKTLNSSLASNPSYTDRFLQEARMATQVPPHANVVSIYDIGTHDDQPFIVMEYVEGSTLASLLTAGPLSLERAAALLQRICSGVSAIHERGIVHRDLKPANIIIGEGFRNTREPKILDFGIAKELGAAPITGDGRIVGTQLYLSPEQVKGDGIDARTDVFALGVIMYECVTGRTPHDGKAIQQWINDLLSGNFRPPSELVANLPTALDVVLGKAMSVSPNRRYASAYEFGAALLPFAGPNTQKLWAPYYTTHDLAMREQLTGPIGGSIPSSEAEFDPQGAAPFPRTQVLNANPAAPSSARQTTTLPPPKAVDRHPPRTALDRSGRNKSSAEAKPDRSTGKAGAAIAAGVILIGMAAVVWILRKPAQQGDPSPRVVSAPQPPEPKPVVAPPEPMPAATTVAEAPPAPPAAPPTREPSPSSIPAEEHAHKPSKPKRPSRHDAAVAPTSNEADQFLLDAEKAFQADHLPEAILLARRAVGAGAGIDANLMLGKFFLRLERYSDARDQYEQVLKRDPGNTSAVRGLKIATEGTK